MEWILFYLAIMFLLLAPALMDNDDEPPPTGYA